MRELLGRFGRFDVIAEAADGNEALQLIITRRPAVAFLDINMPGVSVFESIPSLQQPPVVVFQTAYSEYAAQAYDIDALDYLLKPVRFERLEKTVARIIEKLTSVQAGVAPPPGPAPGLSEHVAVTIGGKTRIIPADDIVRISIENDCSCIYTADERFISDKYLNYYEEKLDGNRFFRTSRSDIISISSISSIQKLLPGEYTVELRGGKKIELSRRKAQELRKIIDF